MSTRLLIFSILINISFLKYRDYKEKQAINEARIKINEIFYLASLNSLKQKTTQKIRINFVKKTISLFDNTNKITRVISLPKNLNYFQTLSKSKLLLNITFTKNGNISTSFSIYIFNLSDKARYKISFYGFDQNKFLKINNYRKLSNNEVYLSNINSYHELTNAERNDFYKDWRKE